MNVTSRPASTPDSASPPPRRGRRFLAFATLGVVLAPFAAVEMGGMHSESPATSNLACATARSVLSQADISYLGAIRMPLATDTTFAYGGFAGRVVNGRTRFFVYGSTVQTPKDQVYEIEDPGAGYSPDYMQAPHATLVTTWGDIYHGKRTSYDASGNSIGVQYVSPGDMYWNESTQLLYWTYYNTYNVSHVPDWGLGATHLDDPATGQSTAYGPWRTVAQDADRNTYYGAARCLYLFSNPLDNTMMCGSAGSSGGSANAWGPDAYGGRPWPTTATPGGFGMPDLSLPNRYLEHYFMGNTNGSDYVDANGMLHGRMRAFRRTTEQPVWENYTALNHTGTTLRVNPAFNGGVGSWTQSDGTTGGVWLELTNKHAVIFSSLLVGSANQNTSDCSGASHEWYSNSGVNPPIGACTHGCAPPVQITGPVFTQAFPAFIIYDPDQLISIRNGQLNDFAADPRAVIDLQQAYNIKTADLPVVGAARSIVGLYYDPVRKYLFTLAQRSDDSRGNREALIHVFAIRD